MTPATDAFTFAEIAGHGGVTTSTDDLLAGDAGNVLEERREVTSLMDETLVTTSLRYLLITPALRVYWATST